MSASVIASALLAAASLSISKPGEYHFVAVPDEMTNALAGVGMGAAVPPGDETPLRYEDAAFLEEAYYERQYVFGTNNVLWALFDQPELLPPWEVPAALGLDALNVHGLMKTHTTEWLGDFEIASGFAVLSTNSVLAAIAGTNAVYKTLDTNLWYVGKNDYRVLDPSAVAGLYADLGKMTRRYSKADIYAVGGTNTYYHYEHTDSDCTKLIEDYGRDGTPLYGTDEPTEYDKRYFDSADYKYKSFVLGEYTKKKSRAVYTDADGKTVVGAEDASYGGFWSYGKNVCPGVAAYIHDNPGWTNIPWVTVKSIRLFGKGTYKRTLQFTKSTKGETSADVTTSVTNGTFVVEIPVDSVKSGGWAFSKMGMGSDDGGIIEKTRALFGDTGITGFDTLKDATPEPDATAAGDDYAGENTVDTRFQIDIEMDEFYAVYELEFNARVKGDGEE